MRAELIQLTAATLGRAPSPQEMTSWLAQLENGSGLDSIAQDLMFNEGGIGRFAGVSNTAILVNAYQALFGRLPDTTGLNYWLNEFNAGRVDLGNLIPSLMAGAVASTGNPNDALILAARAQAAANYLEQAEESGSFSPQAAAAAIAAIARSSVAEPSDEPSNLYNPNPGGPAPVETLTVAEALALVNDPSQSLPAKYAIKDSVSHLILEGQGGSEVLANAVGITASENGIDEVITLTGLTESTPATEVDFADDAATLKESQVLTVDAAGVGFADADVITVTDVTAGNLAQVVGALGGNNDIIKFAGAAESLSGAQVSSVVAAGIEFTAGDVITVTGVAGGDVVTVDQDLDANDRIEVSDGQTVALTSAELQALTATLVAADPGTGTDAVVTVSGIANAESLTATGLADTFDVSGLTDAQSASITGFGAGDQIDTGVAGLVKGAISDNDSSGNPAQAVEVEITNNGSDTTITYQIQDNDDVAGDATSATITLVGVAYTDGDFSVDGNGVLSLV